MVSDLQGNRLELAYLLYTEQGSKQVAHQVMLRYFAVCGALSGKCFDRISAHLFCIVHSIVSSGVLLRALNLC